MRLGYTGKEEESFVFEHKYVVGCLPIRENAEQVAFHLFEFYLLLTLIPDFCFAVFEKTLVFSCDKMRILRGYGVSHTFPYLGIPLSNLPLCLRSLLGLL